MKRSVLLLLCLLSLCAFQLTVYAHPGGTDAFGGHTNSDTGEYHYHHGRPAHDHYDMDGDGVIDCPYDFTGKTDSNAEEAVQQHRDDIGTISQQTFDWDSLLLDIVPRMLVGASILLFVISSFVVLIDDNWAVTLISISFLGVVFAALSTIAGLLFSLF